MATSKNFPVAYVMQIAIAVSFCPLTRAQPVGDLDRRIQLSFDRLQQPDYAAREILAKCDPADWPGDIPGRLILAWTTLAQTTGHEPAQLKELINGLPSVFNAKGYIGPILDLRAINEQQISGHGWLISGLCRYYVYSGDPRAREWVARMISELALPLTGKYHTYPRSPDDRGGRGRALGTLTGRVINDWRVSTDVGCCHILLEGLVAAERIMPSPELEKLIEEACESFLATDVRAVQAQAHASLCAARNVLLYDEMTGLHHGWLAKIEAFYRIYHDEAMTETEANWNWFGRPSWSEPCAIVDSFLLTTELWRVTGRPEYLDDAQRIFYNGMGYGQKPNGGFGCDVFTAQDGMGISNRHWDVPWCCNMRGAVGLTAAAAARTEWRGDTLLLPFFSDGQFSGGGLNIQEQTGWPIQGEVTLRFSRDGTTPQTVRTVGLYVPAEYPRQSCRVTVDGQAISGEWKSGFLQVSLPEKDAYVVHLQMDIPLLAEPPHNIATRKDLVTLRHGLLVLGTPDGQKLPAVRVQDLQPLGQGRYKVRNSEVILEPISQMPFTSSTEAAPWRAQVLFEVRK